MKTKQLSKTTRMKISESCKKRKMPETWKDNVSSAVIARCAKPVMCTETGKRFESISSAARNLGVSPIQVSRVCRGLRYSVHGVSFSFCHKKEKRNG